jgi:hypothetical protein
MPLARLNGKLLFFVHVPKCGGTSIKRFLETHGTLALDGRGGRDKWSECTADHVHAKIYRHLVPEEFYDHGFIVFRDPVERLKSEFRMYARPAFRSLNPINWLLAGYARLRGRPIYAYRFLNRYWLMDPDLWAHAALWIARRRPYRGNNHYRPQAAFWQEGLTPFFLEDGLDQVIHWIVERTDLDSAAAIQIPRVDPAPLPSVVREVPFSPSAEARIRRFYAEDYALFDRLKQDQGRSS